MTTTASTRNTQLDSHSALPAPQPAPLKSSDHYLGSDATGESHQLLDTGMDLGWCFCGKQTRQNQLYCSKQCLYSDHARSAQLTPSSYLKLSPRLSPMMSPKLALSPRTPRADSAAVDAGAGKTPSAPMAEFMLPESHFNEKL